MGFLAFGINHKTAAVDLRERVAFAPEQLADALMRGIRRYFANNPPLARTRQLS